MARATDVRVRKKFNGCLDASASHLHFFPSCSSASWQHSNENGRYAAILRDGVGISETNEGLTSDQEASLRRTIQMRFCWFKKRKEKRKKRIQCEGCWNLALGWVEVVPLCRERTKSRNRHEQEMEASLDNKTYFNGKKEQRAQREEVTHKHHIWWRTEVNLAQQLGGHDSANGIHLVGSALEVSWRSACGGWLVLCCENTLVAVAGGFLWDPLGNIGSLSQAPGQC